MRYIYIVLLVTLFSACSTTKIVIKEVPIKVVEYQEKVQNEKLVILDEKDIIYDLKNLPQDITQYTKQLSTNEKLYNIQNKYEKYYFSMWNLEKPREKLKDVKWPFDAYKVGRSYGENFQLLPQSFFDKMYDNANFDKYATLNLKAITLKESNIRGFPTIRPLLLNPNKAGEGFPFDYLQNSTVHANKPILISHYSKDKAWVYIFTSFTSGWIKASEVVVLKKKYTDLWQKAKQIKITEEGVAIYDKNKNFLFNSKIGMMFALVSENIKTYTILTVSKYKNHTPLFVKATIPKSIGTLNTLHLNKNNLSNIINEVKQTNYGWGGLYGQRDCSSMLRDMFSPFGIWLPRNSYQQSKIGKVIPLENLSSEKKIALIKQKAIPFETLLYKKGHIVLYVGTYNDEIVIFHNNWGIKTKKDNIEGRIIVGRPIFSSLKVGKNQKNYDKSSEILKNLKTMNILTQ